jgi:glycosyltransferase involved in cell wall biosynthesis
VGGKALIYLVDASVAQTGALVAARREARLLADVADYVLILPRSSAVRPADAPEFRDIRYLPMVQLRRSVAAVLLYLPSLLWCGWRLRRILREAGCTRLQINDFYLMQGAVARLLGYRGRLITWVRIDPLRFGRLGRLWLRAASRASDRLVAVSLFIRERLAGREDVALVYDPAPATLAWPSKPAGRRLLFIANYVEGKGQDAAIRAFDRIAARFPDAELQFHGGDMGLEKNKLYRDALKTLAAQSPAADRIRFGGFVDYVADALRGARAALNFSASESFSMTCLEASAAGIPVIATRCGGPAEIVEDGVSGYLVEVGDTDVMAERMARLLEDEALARAMGEAGAALVAERFGEAPFRRHLAGLFALPADEAR